MGSVAKSNDYLGVVDAAAEMQYYPPWRPVRATIDTYQDAILVGIFYGSCSSFSTESEGLRATKKHGTNSPIYLF